jgi:phage shock protein A
MIVVPIVLTGLALVVAHNEALAKPKPPRGPKGPGEKVTKDLQHAYDRLREVSWILVADKVAAPPQSRELFDSAKELYRSAQQAFTAGDREGAGEMAKAAHDAARGLKHSLEAQQPPVAGLPAPPAQIGGPLDRFSADSSLWIEARDLLQRAYDRIQIATDTADAGSASRLFLEASRRAYTTARRAYSDGDYSRATDLARAAEAWSHVGEHILKASGRQVARGPLLPPPADRIPSRRPAGAEPPPPLN